MSILYEQRLSDSPLVESVTHGHTVSDGSTIRPAECHWHMVLVKHRYGTQALVVGPLTTAGVVSWGEGAEILWLKFKLGTYMPRMPTAAILNTESLLPEASSQSFWLDGSAWQFPDIENVETFINRLARREVLVRDPVVNAVLRVEALLDKHPLDEQRLDERHSPAGHAPAEHSLDARDLLAARPSLDDRHDLARHDLAEHAPASRTVRHRFLHTTGLSHNRIRQIERAQRASEFLQQGKSILDTVQALGFFDQPHLTRALKQWVGYTPAQLIRSATKDLPSPDGRGQVEIFS